MNRDDMMIYANRVNVSVNDYEAVKENTMITNIKKIIQNGFKDIKPVTRVYLKREEGSFNITVFTNNKKYDPNLVEDINKVEFEIMDVYPKIYFDFTNKIDHRQDSFKPNYVSISGPNKPSFGYFRQN